MLLLSLKRRGLILPCLALCGLVVSLRAAPAEIWIAPNGADANGGTREQPLATLDAALRKARDLRRVRAPEVRDGVSLIMRGGAYPLSQSVLVRPEDSGTPESPTTIRAAEGEAPVLSGGVQIVGWRKLQAGEGSELSEAARKHVWIADTPVFNGRPLEFRQLYVYDGKAVRAREPDGDEMVRIVDLELAREEVWVPATSVAGVRTSMRGVEMFLLQQWAIAVLRVRSVRVDGERAAVMFHSPESRIQFEHPWPQPVLNKENPARNSAFHLVGAPAFLDQPGEWVQDLDTGHITYWPVEGVDMQEARVVAPALETLVRFAGSPERPVSYVEFRDIELAHSTWMRPSLLGHVPHQAGMPMIDAYKMSSKGTPDWRSLDNQAWIERPAAGVVVSEANHVRFERCTFRHFAMSGLDLVRGVQDSVIKDCRFLDMGGNAIQAGHYGDAGTEIHLPWDPKDERTLCARVNIVQNRFDVTGSEDWGCVAISAGVVREFTIEHNDISDAPYSAISVGWGWTRTPHAAQKNIVRANRIQSFGTRLADCGGIYMLGAQPGSLVEGNVIAAPVISPWVHDPLHWGFVYLDEGSSFTTVRDNWCPTEKFIKNANGPGNVWERNGPTVPEAIRAAAGFGLPIESLSQ